MHRLLSLGWPTLPFSMPHGIGPEWVKNAQAAGSGGGQSVSCHPFYPATRLPTLGAAERRTPGSRWGVFRRFESPSLPLQIAPIRGGVMRPPLFQRAIDAWTGAVAGKADWSFSSDSHEGLCAVRRLRRTERGVRMSIRLTRKRVVGLAALVAIVAASGVAYASAASST